MQNRLILYFKKPKARDKWFWGDRYPRALIHRIFRKKNVGSIEKVFLNLCKGFDLLNVPYLTNLPFKKIKPHDRLVVLGAGKDVLEDYHQPNKIVAGIGLMTHPSNWPDLFEKYPVAYYLQHSAWTAEIYNRFYGDGHCEIWPAGIDTTYWKPDSKNEKTQVLVYEKFLWDQEKNREAILNPIINFLTAQQIDYQIITYGSYQIEDYKSTLSKSYAMIFLCEHESQGLAYQEAMAMDVPILAWNQGFWLDQNRFEWGETEPVKASSVPYFSETCGETFTTVEEFKALFPGFNEKARLGQFNPRTYIMAHLTLEKSAERMIEILNKVYQ